MIVDKTAKYVAFHKAQQSWCVDKSNNHRPRGSMEPVLTVALSCIFLHLTCI